MALRYLQTSLLSGGHTSKVTAVAFSPKGKHLASAALDGKACIWNPSTGRLLHVFSSAVPILSLTWASPEEDVVVCGLQDGTMVSLIITQEDLVITGFWAHSYPVECLSVKGNLLASGAHEEARVWRQVGEEWVQETELPAPPKTSFNRLLKIVVTSVHWLHEDSRADPYLVVTYLNHGVHVFDPSTWQQIRSIPIPGQIADTSISRDGKLIAISNIITGFDVYSVQSGQSICSVGHTVGQYRKVPVLFIHDGLALAGGNVQGDVHLWDVHSGRKLHSLHHRKHDEVLAITAYYEPSSDTFLLATGVLNGSSDPCVLLWKAEELGGDSKEPLHVPRERSYVVPCTLIGILIVLSLRCWL